MNPVGLNFNYFKEEHITYGILQYRVIHSEPKWKKEIIEENSSFLSEESEDMVLFCSI